jgi:ribosomal protein S3AE
MLSKPEFNNYIKKYIKKITSTINIINKIVTADPCLVLLRPDTDYII